jgi:outer membrane receptor for ferrienterochelin and colicin
MRHLLTSVVILISSNILAQSNGFVRGRIADGEFGGAMLGATITLENNPGVGTVTDMDGNYSLSLPEGTYNIKISFISYSTQIFKDVKVKAGEVTMIDATLKSSAEELAVVEVVAEARRDNETAMLMDMKKATNVTDGLSSQTFRKVGDSDLSGAVKRVTGVTVQGGKYVYVRGLGDRYTKSNLNNLPLPSLDPDVNSVQIDVFPTNVLENVAVYKTFTPDLEGDFSGGLVNIVTKKFPESKNSNVTFGLTFVPGMHFQDDMPSYQGGKWDWLGYDDGMRGLDLEPKKKIPNSVMRDAELESITRKFSPEMAVRQKNSMPNMSFAFSHGNQKTLASGASIGYNAVVNYRHENILYRDFVSNDYIKDNDADSHLLVPFRIRQGDLGKQISQWSGLLSGAYKTKRHNFSLVLFNTQNGESTATERSNQDLFQNQSILIENVLTYQQRTLSTLILNGYHRLGLFEVNWGNALSYSRVYDPDFRETRISVTDGDTNLATGAGAGIDRFWRDLKEYNETFKADVKYQVGENMELKAGGLITFKSREFTTQAYKFRRTNLSDIEFDPNWFFAPENIWTVPSDPAQDPEGTFVIGNYQPANVYEARQNVFAGFLMAQQRLFKKLKLIYGARVESSAMYYTGEDNFGLVKFNDSLTLDETVLLPSLNAVFELSPKINIRGAANRTIARPTFKEKSIAQIYDPITKRTFVGNMDLQQTEINNFDFRVEYFPGGTDLFSVGVFYKQFNGHIELVSFPTAPDNFKPRNSGVAQSYGFEFEGRKTLGNPMDSSFLSRFSISANFSLVRSIVDLKSVLVDNSGETEFELRSKYLRTGEAPYDTRPMAGQTPYAVNVMLSYKMPRQQINTALSYNVQGEELSIIGSGRTPDIYRIPFHSLNFNASKDFGKESHHRVTLSLNNLLDEDVTLVYRSHGAEDEIFTSYKPGVAVGLKYGYTF